LTDACVAHTSSLVRTDTIANVLGAFGQALTDCVDGALAEEPGQPHTGAAALVHLAKYCDTSIDGLRKPLGLSHPGCVRLVDRLEDRRLVTRGEGTDRRARALRLTTAGETVARTILRSRQAALRRALRTLTPRERATLGRLAGKVLASLARTEDDALAVCRLCDYASCPDAVCPVARALEA
jgi:DNA-binding MarR family transcriptional regulator